MSFLRDYHPVRAKLLSTADGKSKGTGFIELKSAEYATMAIKNL